jgi:hypothetical protein
MFEINVLVVRFVEYHRVILTTVWRSNRSLRDLGRRCSIGLRSINVITFLGVPRVGRSCGLHGTWGPAGRKCALPRAHALPVVQPVTPQGPDQAKVFMYPLNKCDTREKPGQTIRIEKTGASNLKRDLIGTLPWLIYSRASGAGHA